MKPFESKWGLKFESRDQSVDEQYFSKLGTNPKLHIFLPNCKPTYVLVESIVYMKFVMLVQEDDLMYYLSKKIGKL